VKLGVVFIHGIGVSDPDWAKDLMQKVHDGTRAELANRLGSNQPQDLSEVLETESVYWADILEKGQQELYKVLESRGEPLKIEGNLLQKLFRFLGNLVRRFQSKFVADFIADIIGYLEPRTKELIHAKITAALTQLGARAGGSEERMELTIVSHSLGTVASSDYVWDRTQGRDVPTREHFRAKWMFTNFFTIGSPLAMFSLKYGGPSAFGKPVVVEHPRGRWVNVFDTDDPVGMPLKPLNREYQKAVLEDVRVDAGPYLVSHMAYFDNQGTIAIICRKLALDWLALNRKLPESDLARLYSEYDQNLGVEKASRT
jgi:hypothetical protein